MVLPEIWLKYPLSDAPNEPVTGGATEPSTVAEVSPLLGQTTPSEAFTRILHDADGHENTGEKERR